MKILELVFPMIYNHKTNGMLRNKLKNSTVNSVFNDIENPESITTDILKDEYLDTLKIKDKLEDKAKTNVVGITIAITLIMGASSIITSIDKKFDNKMIQWCAFVLFCVAVLYMLYAGIVAIKILINENEIYTVQLNNIANEEKLRNDYDKCIVNNRIKNLIRNNGVYTSYECIRNAFVCLFFVLLLSIFPYALKGSSTSIIENQNSYTYTFSENAINYLGNHDVKRYVEKVVENEICHPGVEENQVIGIIDDDSHLFIKFKCDGELINILLIESYRD